MKKIRLMMLALLMAVGARAQISCGYTVPATPAVVSQGTCSSSCGVLAPWIPVSTDSIIWLKLNFWFPKATYTTGIYDGITVDSANKAVAKLNAWYDSLYAPQLPFYPAPQYVKRPRIKFKMHAFHMVTDDSLYYQPKIWYSVWTPTYCTSSSDAVDIVFQTCNAGGISQTNNTPGSYIVVYATYTAAPLKITDDMVKNIAHECGHAMGLHHTNMGNVLGCIDYNNEATIPDNACVPGDTTRTNNIMSATGGCARYLSPQQIALCRYQLLHSPVLIPRRDYYGTTPGTVTPTNYTLAGTQTIYTLAPFGVITVTTGANITISNASLKALSGAKIIVQKGAKLSLLCSNIQPQQPNTYWDGIEVWGDPNLTQGINGSGLMPDQGYLVMVNTNLLRAVKAVSLGKVSNYTNHLFYNSTGGGVVQAEGCQFLNCINSVDFSPKCSASICGGLNKSYFKTCDFTTSADSFPQVRWLVRLNGVNGVKFQTCNFDMGKVTPTSDTVFCIKGINSKINVEIAPSNVACNFYKADYAVFLSGGQGSTFQDCNYYTRNGIFLSHHDFAKIVRNTFYAGVLDPANIMRSNLYLDECTSYKVEGNNFYNVSTVNRQYSEGVCVNRSGAYSNQIYNNVFQGLGQGLWCQNQNYDPTTGIGLRANCNGFNLNNYEWGIQSAWTPPLNANTGIAITQGLPTATLTDNVRNTYAVSGTCSNTNKFYMFTPYFFNNPLYTHGNFNGTQFSLGPQPGCSNQTEILNLQGITPTVSAFSYCPDNSYLPVGKLAHTASISILLDTLVSLNGQLAQIDGAETQTLLALIADTHVSNVSLEDTLMSKPYLSDTVLKAYFNRSDITKSYARPVHVKNAPVLPAVWDVILGRSYSGADMDTMTAHQELARLSPRNEKQGRWVLRKNDLAYEIAHKVRWFLDSAYTDTYTRDSIAALIRLQGEGDVHKRLIELDIQFEQYDSALAKINTYTSSTSPRPMLDYANFMTQYISLLKDTANIFALRYNTTMTSAFYAVADSSGHPCRQIARNVLDFVYNSYYEIQKLMPESGTGGRKAQPGKEANKLTSKYASEILIYPNPASNELFIENYTGENPVLRIYNVSGQLLMQQKLSDGKQSINTGVLLNGIYFVNLSDKNGLGQTKKLVIVR